MRSYILPDGTIVFVKANSESDGFKKLVEFCGEERDTQFDPSDVSDDQ